MRLILPLLASVTLTAPAWGQVLCRDDADISKQLSTDYGETVIARGLTKSQPVNLLRLWSSEGGETWTLTVTLPNGNTCLIGAGENWQPVAKPKGPGA